MTVSILKHPIFLLSATLLLSSRLVTFFLPNPTFAASNLSLGPEAIAGTTLANENVKLLDNNKFITFHSMNTLQAGSVQGETVTYGPTHSVGQTIGTAVGLSQNNFVFAYSKDSQILAQHGTLDGLSISLGEKAQIDESQVYLEMFSQRLEGNIFLLCWRTSKASIKCTVGELQNNQMSFTSVNELTNQENGYEMTASKLVTNKFLISYATFDSVKSAVGTYSMNDKTLSFGNKEILSVPQARYPFVVALSKNKGLLTYTSYTYESVSNYASVYVVVVNVSETSLSYDSKTKVSDGASYSILGAHDSSSFWVGYKSNKMHPGAIENGSIRLGDAQDLGGVGGIHFGLAKLATSKYLLKYWENARGVEGNKTALVHRLMTALTNPTQALTSQNQPSPTSTPTAIPSPTPTISPTPLPATVLVPTTTSTPTLTSTSTSTIIPPANPNAVQDEVPILPTQPTNTNIPPTKLEERNLPTDSISETVAVQKNSQEMNGKGNAVPFYKVREFWIVQFFSGTLALVILLVGYKEKWMELIRQILRSA